MPESATNIFSMAPPVSLKGGESIGENSTSSGDTSSKNSSSFSSELSLAEDRQRSGFAEGEKAEERVGPTKKRVVNADTDVKAGIDSEKVHADSKVSDNDETAVNDRVGKKAMPSDVTHAGLKISDLTSNTASSSLSAEDLASVKPLNVEGDETPLAGPTSKLAIVDEAIPKVEQETVSALIKQSISPDVEQAATIPSSPPEAALADIEELVVEGGQTKLGIPDEATSINSDIPVTVEVVSSEPVAGVAVALNATSELTQVATSQPTDSSLLASSKVGTTPLVTPTVPNTPAVLSDAVSTPLAPVPQAVAAAVNQKGVTLATIDKRLGRLSATIEPTDVRQADNVVVQGETKNSLKVDTTVTGLRSQALGLDAEKPINPSTQSPGSMPTVGIARSSNGVLVSDLALPRETTASVSTPQANLTATNTRPLVPPAESIEGTAEGSLMETVAPLNQSTGRTESGVSAAIGSSKDAANVSLASAGLDHMLATSTSGIVTAPIQGRVDVVNTQTVSSPLQAPLNVPLLASSSSEVLSGNIRWMVGEGIQNATVSVTPSGMGPITVQIGVEKEQMSISIIATQASTREALEATLPRLREQLGTQGLESVRVDISDGRSDQSKSNTGSDRQAMGGNSSDSQNSSAEKNGNNENSSNSFTSNNELDSGERVLSDTERDLLSRLQEISSDPSVAQTTIRHGYDLYV